MGLTDDSIFVRVEFTGPISRWSQMALNSIDGFIDFDFDDHQSTGYPAATQEFGAVDAQMGVESYISLRDDGNGHLLRRDGQSDQWENVNVAFAERSLIVRFATDDPALHDVLEHLVTGFLERGRHRDFTRTSYLSLCH